MGGRRARVVLAMATGTAGIQFKKYHGLGNDFVLIDNRHQSEPVLSPEVRRSTWLYLSIYPVSWTPYFWLARNLTQLSRCRRVASCAIGTLASGETV